jgi:hypothetical protein
MNALSAPENGRLATVWLALFFSLLAGILSGCSQPQVKVRPVAALTMAALMPPTVKTKAKVIAKSSLVEESQSQTVYGNIVGYEIETNGMTNLIARNYYLPSPTPTTTAIPPGGVAIEQEFYTESLEEVWASCDPSLGDGYYTLWRSMGFNHWVCVWVCQGGTNVMMEDLSPPTCAAFYTVIRQALPPGWLDWPGEEKDF